MTEKIVVLSEVDRCTKCRGCVVACKRNNGCTPQGTADSLAADNWTVIKSQSLKDYPPLVKYNCWHCEDPPCVAQCPFNAMAKAGDGAVYINQSVCNPGLCNQECRKSCGRGGIPKIGAGDGVNTKANKCTLCTNENGVSNRLPGSTFKCFGDMALPAPTGNQNGEQAVTGTIMMPACVLTCTGDALKIGYAKDLGAYLTNAGYSSQAISGLVINGSWAWISEDGVIPPTADPYVEDHLLPLSSNLLESSAGKMFVVPALFATGLYALYRKKLDLEETKV